MDIVAKQRFAIKYWVRCGDRNTLQIKGSVWRQMLGQIDHVKMACNICERPKHGTCACEANWSASFTDYGSGHQYCAKSHRRGSTCVCQIT